MIGGTPTVSVVIPAHNAERFVEEAISSVVEQTFPPLECLVIDDGSTDSTADIAARFAPFSKVIRTVNQGVSRARNLGVSEARGDVIAFLDADDVWLPRKLEEQIAVYKRNPEVGLIYTGLHLIDEHGRFLGRKAPPSPGRALYNALLLEGNPMSVAQTGLLPRSVLEVTGGFDERLSTSADMDLAVRVACRFPVDVVPSPLVLYRVYPGQMHRDAIRTLRDTRLVFDVAFAASNLPEPLRGLKRRALANLYVSIAGRYRMQTDLKRFLLWIGRAAVLRPDRVLQAANRLSKPPT